MACRTQLYTFRVDTQSYAAVMPIAYDVNFFHQTNHFAWYVVYFLQSLTFFDLFKHWTLYTFWWKPGYASGDAYWHWSEVPLFEGFRGQTSMQPH